jgi:hypothetical protein
MRVWGYVVDTLMSSIPSIEGDRNMRINFIHLDTEFQSRS